MRQVGQVSSRCEEATITLALITVAFESGLAAAGVVAVGVRVAHGVGVADVAVVVARNRRTAPSPVARVALRICNRSDNFRSFNAFLHTFHLIELN